MEHNVFYQLAQTLWKRGGDGEDIARELALAFNEIVKESDIKISSHDEYARFLRE